MTVKRSPVLLSALALVAALATGCSSESEARDSAAAGTGSPNVVVTDAWVRATSGTDDPSMTAAFMSLENDGADDVLTGASTDVARMTQVHEMVMGSDGAMVMRELEGGLPLPTGAHEHLAPGGNHLMLMGVGDELAPGDEVTLTLEFAEGPDQELTVPVKEFTEEEGSYEHSHAPSSSPTQ